MINQTELSHYLSSLLEAEKFHDYCPNGLQVAGKTQIKKIITGVTACQGLIDAAIKANADAILVHHGYFWKGDSSTITGIKKCRIASLLNHDINLFAYHLPLDAHPVYGNNVQLAKILDWQVDGRFNTDMTPSIGFKGHITTPVTADEFSKQLSSQLQRTPLHLPGKNRTIKQIAWCTGAAQGLFENAITAGVDAYITGEVSEPSFHLAAEYGVHFFAAGHHATERYGIQALGKHLQEQFELEHKFIDIVNPV